MILILELRVEFKKRFHLVLNKMISNKYGTRKCAVIASE